MLTDLKRIFDRNLFHFNCSKSALSTKYLTHNTDELDQLVKLNGEIHLVLDTVIVALWACNVKKKTKKPIKMN